MVMNKRSSGLLKRVETVVMCVCVCGTLKVRTMDFDSVVAKSMSNGARI